MSSDKQYFLPQGLDDFPSSAGRCGIQLCYGPMVSKQTPDFPGAFPPSSTPVCRLHGVGRGFRNRAFGKSADGAHQGRGTVRVLDGDLSPGEGVASCRRGLESSDDVQVLHTHHVHTPRV